MATESEIRKKVEEIVSRTMEKSTDAVRNELATLEKTIKQVIDRCVGILEKSSPAIVPADISALAPAAPTPSMAPSEGGADLRDLCAATSHLEKGVTQAAILNDLVVRASQYCQRIALFIVQGGNAVGWKAAGFTGSGTLPNEQIKNVTIPLTMNTTFRRVYESGITFRGGSSEDADNIALFEKIGNVDPVEIFISPLLFRGKIAALVYGDSGNSAEGILSSDALDILTRVASMSIDLIPMKQKAAPARPAATAAPAAVPAPAAARPAAPAAPAPQEAPAPSPAPAPRVPAAAPPLEGLSDDEKKSHNDARRLARVLVSDLLLYNEAKVAAGRKNKNLYDLLRDDIERSRQLYQQRVPPKVAQVSNYFTEELLNTLAQGDASALKGYPGLA